MKEINLKEIFSEVKGDQPMSWQVIHSVMKQACNQTIELCAEEAKILWGSEDLEIAYQDDLWVNKDSILKVKKAIK